MAIYNKFMTIKLLKDLLPFLWVKQEKIRELFLLSSVLIFLTIGLNLSVPIILKMIVLELSLTNGNMSHQLFLLLVASGLIWTLSHCIQQIRQIIMVRPLERGLRLFCSNFFNHLHSLPISFHVDKKIGSLTNAIERAQKGLPDVFWGLFLIVIPTIIELLLSSGILCYLYGPVYGLILLVCLTFFIIFSTHALKWLTIIQKKANEQQGETNAIIVDSLINFASVKYFNNKAHEIAKCDKHLKLREKLVIKYVSSIELVRIGHHIIIGLGITLLTYTAGKQVVAGIYNVSDFILINGYILQLAVPLGHMGFVSRDISRGLNEMSSVMDIYKMPTVSNSEKSEENLNNINHICFKDVSFRYDNSRTILRNINFSLKKGETIGIVGETGSGKSTIANLLFNFYDVYSGKILINGKNINKIKFENLCSLLGIVSQDTTLFNTTIYDNILFGNPKASQEEVEKVIKIAHLDSFLKKLPDHYYTLVGERGLKLSGGEKQRIIIARVLLKKPSLYIFDEATSSLDLETEKNIMNSIKEITRKTSSIIIAHRLTAVMHANEILVIRNGLVQERGSHQKLLKNNGPYASLWRSQSKSLIS